MYIRLVVYETISEEQTKELVKEAHHMMGQVDEVEVEQPLHVVMAEEGGNMVILETRFADRTTCLRFHSSRNYRQFAQKVAPLTIGQPVVKLFRAEEH